MSARRQLLYALGADVVIGKRESVRGNKRTGAAVVEANRGEADVIEPLLGQFESVFGFDLVFRRSVVEPHALIGEGDSRAKKYTREQNGKKAFHSSMIPSMKK